MASKTTLWIVGYETNEISIDKFQNLKRLSLPLQKIKPKEKTST